MPVLVTGGAGLLGTTVTAKMLEEGHTVIVYDLVPLRKTPAHLAQKLKFVQGNILDFPHLVGAMISHDVDRIVHLAAFLQFATEQDPRKGTEININGTLNILEGARIAGVKKIVFASSVGVYGLGQELYVEDMAVRPGSLYGVAKLFCEKLGERFMRVHGVDFVALRFGAMFGPQQASTPGMARVIGDILSINSGARVEVSAASADTKVHFVYVKDSADGVLAALFAERLPHAVYNIAGPDDCYVSLDQFAAIIREVCPGSGEVTFSGPKWPGNRLDITRARQQLGYRPKYSLKEGIADCIALMKQSG